jgi:hypothetical protein
VESLISKGEKTMAKKLKTKDYIRRAQDNYNSKFDLVRFQVPLGTKERIRKLQDKSINKFCAELILAELERLEAEQNN